ncbi:Alstrom syndrome protein 1 isoform X1 [Huso huso]|uniref:Alstrom syndrome protein 1 isoform X1 n=1 Tax=Huso huso TaxID=61971 RepID=A0ABR1A9E8_HUSHU
MSRIGDQTLSPSTRAVSAFSPSSLEVDNYAPYWATNPTSPAKSTELNIEERIPVYLRNLGIDQSPSAILTPFAPRGPIREPEFSMKGSTCTPTKSVQQSEGGSPMKGDFSQSSIFSVNSTLSMSIPMGSDVDTDTPVPAESSVQEALRSSTERPVSQCSLQTAFHPLDRSLDVPPQQPSQATSDQKESRDAEPLPASEPSSPDLNDSGNLISTRVKNLIDKFESSAGNATSDSLPSSPLADKDCQARLSDAQAEAASWLATEASCRGLDLGDDSFVGSKTLQEIRKLLGEAENVVSGRSSFSSLSTSLKGSDDFSSFLHRKLDSFQDSFTSTVDNKESESSLLWRKSSSESMLTLDGLKDSSLKDSSLLPIAASHRASSDASGQICVSKEVEWGPLGEVPWEAVRPSFTAKTRRRSEPEGCSEAIQKKVAPTSIALRRVPRDMSQEVDDGRGLAQELTGRLQSATPEYVETVPKKTPHVSDLKEGEKVTASDNSSSVDSLAARVATLLKDESPATMASSIITEADEEERKARDWVKLKLAGEQCEPLELGKEDRLRIEEIKAELLQNTKNKNTTKAQWTTDSDSDATSSGDVHLDVPFAGATRQFLALNAVKHQISSQMQKLTSNPFDTSVELCTPLRRDRDALLREIAQREGVSGVGAASQMATESNKPIASITFSSRKRTPSPSISSSPHVSPEVLHLRQLSESGSDQSGNERDTELERRQARSLHTMPGTLSDSQGHSSSPRGPTNANSHAVSIMQDRVPQPLAGQVPECVPRSDIYEHSNTLRGIAWSQQDELDAVQKAENRSGIDRFIQEPYSGYGFYHHYQDPASQKLRLSEESAWNRQVDQEKDDFTPATEIIPLAAPEHRLLRSPMKHGPEKSAIKQMSRSTPNLSLKEKATVEPNNMESSAAPLQISSFASGTSCISSPTKKVLSYVHVTLSPKPVNGKSTCAENEFRFENSHPRLEDSGANFYPETRSVFPSSSRMPTPQLSSDVSLQMPITVQGPPCPTKAVSTIGYGGYSEGVGVAHEPRTALNSHQSVPFSGQRSPLVLQNESTKQEGKKTSIPTQTVRSPSADAMTQITTHVPDKSLFTSETTTDAGHSTRHHISTTPRQQLHRMSRISPNTSDQASDQPVLLPYKPHGSHAMFYIPHLGTRVSPVRSDTTIESSHPGSDDALPPKFTAEVLGSRDKEIEIDVTTRHKEGIYSKRALPTTVWEQNEMTPGGSQKIPAAGRIPISEESQGQSHPGRHHQYIENPEHMQSPRDLSRSSTAQHSGSSPRGTHQSNKDLRREVREFSIDKLDFSRDLEDGEFAALRGEPDYSMDEINQHLSSVREDLTSTRTGRHWTSKDRGPPLSSGRMTTASHRSTDPTSDRSMRSSGSLHKLWEKFKERQRQEPVDSKEYSLLERLDRLSRLLNNPVQHSILSVEENERSRSEEERHKSRKREEAKREPRDTRGHCMQQAWVQKLPEPEGTLTSIQTKDGISFRSSSTLEPIREISTERIQRILSRQKDSAREERDSSFCATVSETDTAVQTESGSAYPTDTGSTISTIDTARLIRAFGPKRVTLNPSLSRLYSTIDKQRDSLEQKGQRKRASKSHGKPAAPPAQYSTEESTMTCDSVSSASTYSLPAPRVPSSALTSKKAVKLVSKSIQAGDLEIVNSATKKNTRDVGMTFPSPNLARAVHMQAPSNPDLQSKKMGKKTQDFLYEKKTKRSNRQRHPRGVCWFVPADELKSESKKENQPSSEPGPGSAWFAPLGYTKRWREPLREKHTQEQLVSRILEQPITNQAISNKGLHSFVRITLQEALEMRRPDFVSRSRERMKRLELHAEERRMQSVFNSERENLFNNPTTKRGWRATNPDQQTDEEIPMVQKRRTVSKKEMFTRSKQMYSQLPEIRQRREEERRREEYKSYRLKAELYKKKITNHVLGRKTPWQ